MSSEQQIQSSNDHTKGRTDADRLAKTVKDSVDSVKANVVQSVKNKVGSIKDSSHESVRDSIKQSGDVVKELTMKVKNNDVKKGTGTSSPYRTGAPSIDEVW